MVHSGGSPGLRPVAIAAAADAVAELHFIDVVYGGERLSLGKYAQILLEYDNPLPCCLPGNERGRPDFSWPLTMADVPEIILLAAARIAEREREVPALAFPREGDELESGLDFPD